MDYAHTQRSPLSGILNCLALVTLLFAYLAWQPGGHPIAAIALLAVAVITAAAATMFGYLTVRDEGDCLAVLYGPLPVFSTRIAYAEITTVEQDRSSIIDGWGVHWVPGRGMTYNLWGFDCAKLHLGKRVIRIGSDDVENLVEFLRGRIGRTD